jgi:hypothetical protein
MLSYSESTALGYEPESRKEGVERDAGRTSGNEPRAVAGAGCGHARPTWLHDYATGSLIIADVHDPIVTMSRSAGWDGRMARICPVLLPARAHGATFWLLPVAEGSQIDRVII